MLIHKIRKAVGERASPGGKDSSYGRSTVRFFKYFVKLLDQELLLFSSRKEIESNYAEWLLLV